MEPDELAAYEAEKEQAEKEATRIVYIAEGNQLGYLPGKATDDLCWGRD